MIPISNHIQTCLLDVVCFPFISKNLPNHTVPLALPLALVLASCWSGDGVSSPGRTGWEDHHHIETGWPTWMEVVEIWLQQFCRTNVPARSCYIKRAGPKNVFKGTTNQLHTQPSISLALHQKKCFLWSVHRLNPFCSVKSC